jgi:hypothetical protein
LRIQPGLLTALPRVTVSGVLNLAEQSLVVRSYVETRTAGNPVFTCITLTLKKHNRHAEEDPGKLFRSTLVKHCYVKRASATDSAVFSAASEPEVAVICARSALRAFTQHARCA